MTNLIRRDSLPAGLLLAAVLTCGAMLLWLMALGFSAMIWSFFQPSRISKSLVFTRDAEPLIQVHTPIGDTWNIEYFTLEGKPVDTPGSPDIETYLSSLPAEGGPFRLHRDWRLRLIGFLQRDANATYWYLVDEPADEHRPYFVGFDGRSKQRVGYIGRQGFVPSPPPLEDRFEISPLLFYEGGWVPSVRDFGSVPSSAMTWPRMYLASGGELLALDLERRSVEPVALPGKVLGVGSYEQERLIGERQDKVSDKHVAVRLPGRLWLMTIDGQPIVELELPPETDAMSLSLSQFANGLIVVNGHLPTEYQKHSLFTYSPDGKLTRQQVADVTNPPLAESAFGSWLVMGFCPLPAGQMVISVLEANNRVQTEQEPNLAAAYRAILAKYWLPFLTLVLVSLIAAIYVYRRQQKYNRRHALAWGVFVLLFGVPGLIGYLLHRRWPHRAQCEHCGRLVPRVSQQCLACQADFSPPELKGIEIFAERGTDASWRL